MYVFDGLLLFFTQKRLLKVKINQNSLGTRVFSLIEPYGARNIKKLKTDELNINAPIQ